MPENNDKNNFKFDMGNKSALLFLVVLVALFLFFISLSRGDNAVEISYSQFLQDLIREM